MRKIKTLFLSTQPSVLAALISFFTNDPLVLSDFDDYANYNKHRKKCEVVVFDDGSLKNNEFEMIKENIPAKENGYEYCSYAGKILYTYNTNKEYLRFFESKGIDGIVSKRADMKNLKEAIINVARGKKYYCKYVKDFLSENDKDTKGLTARENEILQLVKEGYKNKDIAEKLFLSPKTISTHKENIKQKFGLKTVNEIFKLNISLT